MLKELNVHCVDPEKGGALFIEVTSLLDHKAKTAYEALSALLLAVGYYATNNGVSRQAVFDKLDVLFDMEVECDCGVD